jgi:hypothetical protein
MKPKPARSLWITFAAASLAASQAAAQADPDVMAATRRELVQEAQQARASRDHLRALELANRAGQLGMSTALRRFIAEEQSALGLLGAALDSAERCVREAPRDTSPASAEHAAACDALATDLRPRVARAVDEAPPPSAPPPRRRAAPAAPALPVAEPRGSLNPGPVAVMGVGAAGFITAGVFYLLRGSALNARDSLCDETGCPEEARPDHDRAVTYNTLTNISLGVGAACAVGGLVWYLVAPRRPVASGLRETSAPPPRAGLLLAPSAGGALIGWEGSL